MRNVIKLQLEWCFVDRSKEAKKKKLKIKNKHQHWLNQLSNIGDEKKRKLIQK